VYASGNIGDGGWVSSGYGIRPVINLKSTVEISSGIGSINEPYIVKTN